MTPSNSSFRMLKSSCHQKQGLLFLRVQLFMAIVRRRLQSVFQSIPSELVQQEYLTKKYIHGLNERFIPMEKLDVKICGPLLLQLATGLSSVKHRTNSNLPLFCRSGVDGIPIFVTSDTDPEFTTDVGSKQVGSVNVPLSGSGTDRSAGVQMIFGGTEITVECVEKATGKITQLNIDFLMLYFIRK
ncbi:hypothetical protein DPMN_107390 [Dreissena polymorpha]|uniref:Uncharacterized protein n=1 Tax=Dreissena polymorpha TaxID=45954 RepID=A0A9D4K731_DREPO|nr:hypothetical protein DPMN_107390 [Dreissena polymorpha]